MENNQDQINKLLLKLEMLLKKQEDFSKEINSLRLEINEFKVTETVKREEIKEVLPSIQVTEPVVEPIAEKPVPVPEIKQQVSAPAPPKTTFKPVINTPKGKSGIEKFIGENLISKIGIVITVIGVGIGAKYAIDHQMISPLTRVILGYLVGLGLLGFAIKLKKNYDNFSAVLLSGAVAIMYFMTFAAYSFYDLFPQTFAFILMFVFTAFTVVAAITYNKPIIAHIGLIGAYAVPFLLSDGSGKVAILFTYMTIINLGILTIAFKKYWKSLYYSSFAITWIIFLSWFAAKYQMADHFGLALSFLTIFFATFYMIFLGYKLVKKEFFNVVDILMLLTNSFVFFGMGYVLLNEHEKGMQLLGLFTLCNAIIHFVVSSIIYRQKLADRNLFNLVAGLVLVFITITVPVQLDGNWVTLLWAGEAALLFWIGRTKNVSIYEILSYPLMFLAFFSLTHDWALVIIDYYSDNIIANTLPVFNMNFLNSFLFIGAFAFINWLNRNKNFNPALPSRNAISAIMSFSIPAILLFTLYYSFRIEIANYWDQLYLSTAIKENPDTDYYYNYIRDFDLTAFRSIWILNYSMLFVSILSFVNVMKLKSRPLGFINLGLITFSLIMFLSQGLYMLSELRDSYLNQTLAEYYHRGAFNIGIRYVSYVFVVITLMACYKYLRQDFMRWKFKIGFDFLLYTSILWIASSELINWMDITYPAETYKLGLSILWGLYSLYLISIGIWKRKVHLRIGAFSLFGVTLIKLFAYDISHLNTISKTIVFVSLGILLLIISFLYNKFKHIISDETHEPKN